MLDLWMVLQAVVPLSLVLYGYNDTLNLTRRLSGWSDAPRWRSAAVGSNWSNDDLCAIMTIHASMVKLMSTSYLCRGHISIRYCMHI